MSSNPVNEPHKLPWSLLRAGGRHGLSDAEKRDPIGLAVAALNRIASSDLLDSLGLRRASERGVYRVTSAGFRTAGKVGRTFARAGRATQGSRVPAMRDTGLFDLTPGEDEQMLADVVGQFARELLRPAASAANEACTAPALSLWGSEEQQSTYLPAFTGDEVPSAALALSEPTALFDPTTPATVATPDGDGFVLNGVKSGVVRGADAELDVLHVEEVLLRPAAEGHALIQVRRADAFDRLGQMLQRSQTAPGDQ